jgi:archaellum component FlaF (FlaF/FlaG flagellin family)
MAAGSICSITVTFHPTGSGKLTAFVSLDDNAQNSPQSAPLSGTGTVPAVTLTPTSLTFASALINTAAAAKTITLKNTGTGPLSLSGSAITIRGTGAGSFTQSNKCGTSLAAGANCVITVTFKPAAAGTQSAAVNLADNAQGSPHSVPLTGTGTAPAVTLTPTSLAFTSTKVNSSAATQKITLKNTGNGALMLSGSALGISVAGANAKSFSQTNNCGISVAAGGSCTITVSFKPTAAGALIAVLNIADNAGNTPQTVGLSGTGK